MLPFSCLRRTGPSCRMEVLSSPPPAWRCRSCTHLRAETREVPAARGSSGSLEPSTATLEHKELHQSVAVAINNKLTLVCNLISHRLQEVQCRGTSEPQEPHCSHSLWPSGRTAHQPHSYGTSDDCGTLRGGGGTSYPKTEDRQILNVNLLRIQDLLLGWARF